MEGKIKNVSPGYFFINAGSLDCFCHKSVYNQDNPEPGDLVEFEYEQTAKGAKATKARLVMKGMSNISDSRIEKDNPSIMKEYSNALSKGYFDNNGESNESVLKKVYIIDFPQSLASYFQKFDTINKTNQLRKFFDQVRLIEGKLKLRHSFQPCSIELLQLIPLANNAKEKKYISNDFFQFLKDNLELASLSKENFIAGFVIHFQCLIGYLKQK